MTRAPRSTRRRILVAALGTTALAGGCVARPANAPSRNGRRLAKVIAMCSPGFASGAYDALQVAFEADNPGYTVNFLSRPPYMNVEVLIGPASFQGMVDLLPWLRSSNVGKSAFAPGTLAALTTKQGAVEGLPFDPVPGVLAFDHAALTKAGALPPERGWTMQEFLAVLARVRRLLPTRPTLALPSTTPQPLYAILAGYDALPYEGSGAMDFALPATVRTMAAVSCSMDARAGGNHLAPDDPVIAYRPLTGPFPLSQIPRGWRVTRFPTLPQGGTPGELQAVMILPGADLVPSWTFALWMTGVVAQRVAVQYGFAGVEGIERSKPVWWRDVPTSVRNAWRDLRFVPGSAFGIGGSWAEKVWQSCRAPTPQQMARDLGAIT